MKPNLSSLLIGAATAIGTRVLPSLDPEGYAAGDAKLLAMLLILAAQDVGRAPDRLQRENRAMRLIFAEAADAPIGVALAGKLAEAASGADESLLIESLESENDRLSALLIELHELVEQSGAEWAAALDARIWAHLGQAAESRALILPVID